MCKCVCVSVCVHVCVRVHVRVCGLCVVWCGVRMCVVCVWCACVCMVRCGACAYVCVKYPNIKLTAISFFLAAFASSDRSRLLQMEITTRICQLPLDQNDSVRAETVLFILIFCYIKCLLFVTFCMIKQTNTS